MREAFDVGRQVRCWSMRRDCNRLRREKKSSSGKVFEVAFFDGESVLADAADIGLVVDEV